MKKKLDHKKMDASSSVIKTKQKQKRNKLYICILIRHAWDTVVRCGIQEDFNTSRDDTRELALLVGREPAGRGLSSPGTALALSAASLTEPHRLRLLSRR
ncbi:Mucosa-associated lymphoid tissue lymphoma translocation protein [Trichinella spiralis]|uniref:Mucosa-associated lymphoid tissue lymphoma translocation protein n=1 Tax=Trichinella spiralis TaxID=6334 RepID=A0ABR3KW93_TRISP